MNRYDVILIDADDTLFDFAEAERRALAALLKSLDLDGDGARAAYHACNDACWRALERGELTQARLKYKRFEDFLKAMGRADDPVRVGDLYIEILSGEGVLLPGALDVVRAIAAERRVAVVTNGISSIQRGRMAASGLHAFVHALVISEEVGVAKPDPRMIEAALNALGGAAPARALMAGDSLISDVACANRAGVDACWLNRAGASAPAGFDIAYEIRDISELTPIALG